jgi:thiamine pyrophosphate-dependent acetolactate synthase large subunit-like protein
MGLGALATIGVARPANLAIVVLDNERYGETGMQETHTAHGVDLAAVARGCGFPEARVVREPGEIPGVRERIHRGEGPVLFQVKVGPEKLPMVLGPREGALLKNRFREALLGPNAALA